MDKLIIVIGALLIVYALWQTIRRFQGKAKSSCCGSAEAVSARKPADTDVSHYPFRYLLMIDGMSCSRCAVRVENALNALPGIWGKVDLAKNQADVRAKSSMDQARFAAALQDASYSLTDCTEIVEQ